MFEEGLEETSTAEKVEANDLFPIPVWTFDQCGVGKDKILDFVNVVRRYSCRESSNIRWLAIMGFYTTCHERESLGELHDNIIQHGIRLCR